MMIDMLFTGEWLFAVMPFICRYSGLGATSPSRTTVVVSPSYRADGDGDGSWRWRW